MIISDFALKPEQNVYYYLGLIIRELLKQNCEEELLLNKIFGMQPKPNEIYRFNLALYTLILLEKVNYFDSEEGIVYVYQKTND